MRTIRAVVLAAVVLVVGACGGDSSGPKPINAAVLAGSWELVREPNTACFGAGTALQTKYYFTLPAPTSTSSVLNVVSRWEVVQPYRFNWLLSGNFNLSARTVELRFWLVGLETGSMFTAAAVKDDGSATGTLQDPTPGFKPHFVTGSCTFNASIRRVGP